MLKQSIHKECFNCIRVGAKAFWFFYITVGCCSSDITITALVKTTVAINTIVFTFSAYVSKNVSLSLSKASVTAASHRRHEMICTQGRHKQPKAATFGCLSLLKPTSSHLKVWHCNNCKCDTSLKSPVPSASGLDSVLVRLVSCRSVIISHF